MTDRDLAVHRLKMTLLDDEMDFAHDEESGAVEFQDGTQWHYAGFFKTVRCNGQFHQMTEQENDDCLKIRDLV
jgi:hypothetical protein